MSVKIWNWFSVTFLKSWMLFKILKFNQLTSEEKLSNDLWEL